MKFPAFVAALAVLAACSTAAPAAQARPSASSWPEQAHRPVPSLAQAIKAAVRLGPAGAATTVSLNFGLKQRDPNPALVGAAVAYLQRAGFGVSWHDGSSLIAADGPAPAADHLLAVEIDNYRQPDGSTFYATTQAPALPGPIAAVASGVTGLDSYGRSLNFAVKPGGLKALDVLSFYNIKPLRDRGLDGSGETILFPEIESIPQSNVNDLEKFASEEGLPSFAGLLTIKTNKSWGTPEKPEGEAVLDLEIAHEIAPKAKLVAYVAGPQFSFMDRAFDQMVTDNLGSLISESLGACEPGTPSGHRQTYSSIEDRAVAQGMTHLVASGDSGAYTCGEENDVADSFPATLPTVTAVGGTTVFESTQGGYFKEFAWGAAIDESGSGGGPSLVYSIPDWQKPVEQADGHGFRQVPDIAADADPQTGFHIVLGGRDTQIGGTSAAAPMWTALLALVNQDLVAKKLRRIGFANPALYWMGANSGKFSSSPFHDVTAGNNLAYTATRGWDFATGWGSPDGAAIDDAWITYFKSGGG